MLITLYNTSNDYFMAHQPEFMLGLMLVFIAVTMSLAAWDSYNVKRNNQR